MAPVSIIPIKGYLTARAGITAVAQILKRHAQLPQVLDPKFPILGGFPDSAVAMIYIALLAQGQTAFDGVDNMQSIGHPFLEAKIPAALKTAGISIIPYQFRRKYQAKTNKEPTPPAAIAPLKITQCRPKSCSKFAQNQSQTACAG